MKNKLVVIFSVALLFVSAICFSVIFVANSQTTIAIYNPINKTTTTVKATFGKKYKDILKNNFDNDTYVLSDYYYDQNLNNKLDLDSVVTSNTTIFVGSVKNVSNPDQIDLTEKIVGIKYSGNLNSSTLNKLCKFKVIDISDCEEVPTFSENNNIVQF